MFGRKRRDPLPDPLAALDFTPTCSIEGCGQTAVRTVTMACRHVAYITCESHATTIGYDVASGAADVRCTVCGLVSYGPRALLWGSV